MDEAVPRRRPPTPEEARALGHPLRVGILQRAAQSAQTNQQLAIALDVSPGTCLYHVRILLKAGLLEADDVRTGEGGALEKPYRSTGLTWWLDDPLKDADDDARLTPLRMFWDQLVSRPDLYVAPLATFLLHLTPDDVLELDRQLLDVVDRWVHTDADRRRDPLAVPHRGAIAAVRLADLEPAPDRAPTSES